MEVEKGGSRKAKEENDEREMEKGQSLGDELDTWEMLVLASGQLGVCVVIARGGLGEMAQPVAFDPLEVASRLCEDRRMKQKLAFSNRLRRKG